MARFGYLNKTTKTVWLEMEPANGTVLAEFTREGLAGKTTVEGCVIAQATPTNISQDTDTLSFEQNASRNGQLFTETEGGTHKPCEQSATATLVKAKGKGWIMDQEEETFSVPVDLAA